MDSILLGLVLGLIHGKHHDHDDATPPPPSQSFSEAWKAGAERGRNNFIIRWADSLPGGRQWRAERWARRG